MARSTGLQVEGQEVVQGDLGQKSGAGLFLWIGGKETGLVFDQNAAPGADHLGGEKRAHVGAVGWDASSLGGQLPEAVGRHGVHDGDGLEGEVGRQLDDVVVAELEAAVGGQEERDHQGVLLADAGAQLGQDAGGHAKIEGDGVGVPAAGPAAGHDQQLVLVACGYDLVQQWQDHFAPAVDNTLSTQLDDLQVGHGAKDPVGLGALQEPLVHQRLGHPVSYTHLRAHETPEHLVCRLLLEKKKRSSIAPTSKP